MNSIIFKKSVLLYSMMALVLLVSSCSSDQEEYTGAGNVVPTSPQITITPEVSNLSLVEDDSSYSYTVALSTVQLVDVVVKISQVDGDATMGEDFTIDNSLVISAGSTSATGTITILSDELAEETETVTIQVGDNTTANASITPETMTFTILNLSEGDLVIDLDWMQSSSVTDNFGNEADPLDVADLRLLITNIPYTQVLDESDGSEFENYVLTADKPDGEYYIVADFYSATDIETNIDLNVTFNQLGEINDQTYNFTDALNTALTCSSVYFIMAKVIKVGSDYTVSYAGQKNVIDLADYVGTWTGTDMWGPTEVTTTLDADGVLWITGVGVTFMEGQWGEVITDQVSLPMEIDLGTGAFTIDEAYYMTTTYGGAVQDVYNLSGTGVIDICGSNTMDLEYDFVQGGTSYNAWLNQYGYFFVESNVLQ
jgi:hypothetical protein